MVGLVRRKGAPDPSGVDGGLRSAGPLKAIREGDEWIEIRVRRISALGAVWEGGAVARSGSGWCSRPAGMSCYFK